MSKIFLFWHGSYRKHKQNDLLLFCLLVEDGRERKKRWNWRKFDQKFNLRRFISISFLFSKLFVFAHDSSGAEKKNFHLIRPSHRSRYFVKQFVHAISIERASYYKTKRNSVAVVSDRIMWLFSVVEGFLLGN